LHISHLSTHGNEPNHPKQCTVPSWKHTGE
jgi:hypothetical protein